MYLALRMLKLISVGVPVLFSPFQRQDTWNAPIIWQQSVTPVSTMLYSIVNMCLTWLIIVMFMWLILCGNGSWGICDSIWIESFAKSFQFYFRHGKFKEADLKIIWFTCGLGTQLTLQTNVWHIKSSIARDAIILNASRSSGSILWITSTCFHIHPLDFPFHFPVSW